MPSQFNLKKPVQLAVIGAGLIGSKHARIIKNHKASALVGICDIDQTRSSIADSLKVPFYKDPDEMLLKQKPEGVIIATPSSDHENMAQICVARSVNILIEKPIAETAESANNIIKLSHEGGVKILVGHHRRHSPYIKKARSIVMNGEIGGLVAVSMLWTLLKPPEYFDIQWRGNKPSGGPVLINLIHELDILRYICGEINQIFAYSSSSTRNLPVEDSLSISIYFRNGAVGSIIASDSVPSPWSYESTTKENTFYFPTDENCYYFLGTKGSLAIPKMELWQYPDGNKSGWQYPIGKYSRMIPYKDPLISQLEHFCKVIQGKENPISSAIEATRSLYAVLAVQESMTKNIPVKIIQDTTQNTNLKRI